jgi:aminoglycoside phosphotransferase family enzyme/predicted kinase
MISNDQAAVLEFLASPAAHGGSSVERIDTHASVVFLAGARAYKVKRAVSFDYLDFSSLDRRQRFCEAEVRLNRRTAPTLYRGVVPVTRKSSGSLALGGPGVVVEWVVEMNRFDQEQLFDRLAGRDRLDLDLMAPLASAVAAFHRDAERRSDHGGRAGMAWVIDGNAAAFPELARVGLDPSCGERVTAGARRELDRRTQLLESRRLAGFVRQCHGDLHLRNIVLIDGRPTPFDGVEFNDEISCTDTWYDLAFLLMDLWRRRLPAHANTVLNGYLAETGDTGGVALLPLFQSCRAAVRAKTSATSAQLQPDGRRGEMQRLAGEYLALAARLLCPPRPSLVAIGGFSGSGKSTLAAALAPGVGAAPGAVVLRSDEIRKRLCGVSRLDRLGPEGYTEDVNARVYAAIADSAQQILGSGHSVIADAVFGRESDRQSIERVASDLSVPFAGLWLDVPESMLIERVERRRHDPSDADAGVVRMQRVVATGTLDWLLVDATGAPGTVLQRAMSHIQES